MMLLAAWAPRSAAPWPPRPTAAMFNFSLALVAARMRRGSAAKAAAAAEERTNARRFIGPKEGVSGVFMGWWATEDLERTSVCGREQLKAESLELRAGRGG